MAKKLFDYVHGLLSKQDTLVVPDFGAFVLQKTTTFLNDGDYISIIFTAQQQQDDGILKSYIADDTNLTEDEVEEFISSSLEEIYLEINNTGKYNVEGIGEFRAVNDSIVFKPFDEQFLKQEARSEKREASSDAIHRVEAESEKPTLSLEEAAAAFLKDAEDAEKAKGAEKAEVPSAPPTSRTGLRDQSKSETISETILQVEEKSAVSTPPKEETKKETTKDTKPQIEQEPNSAVSKPIDFKKLFTPLIILVVVIILGGTFYFFRNEIANLNKPAVTNDTTQVVTEENMQQLSDTLAEINNSGASNEEAISETPQNIEPTPNTEINSEANNNTTTANVIRVGNVPNITYYVAKGAYNSKQDALTEKRNLDITGFVSKIIETSNGKKYNVVVAEFTNESSAMEELNFSQKIDNQFYLLTVKPNNK